MFTFLKGHRTYVCASILAIVAILHYVGVIDNSLYGGIVGLFGSAGLAALRASVPATTPSNEITTL